MGGKVVNFTLRPLYSWERATSTHVVGDSLGLGSGLDAVGNRTKILQSPVRSLMTTPTALSCLLQKAVKKMNYIYEKIYRRTGHEGPEGGVEVWLYYFFNLGGIWGWVVNAKHRPI